MNGSRSWLRKFGLIAGYVLFLVLDFAVALKWIPGLPGWIQNPATAFIAWIIITGLVIWRAFELGGSNRLESLELRRSRKTEGQLSEEEAFQLLRHYLFFRENIRVGETIDKGTVNVVDPRDQTGEEAVRLYKLVFERKNHSEKVGVFMDLEQEMDVDLETFEDKERAIDEIENKRMIRSSKVDEFDEALNDARADLGKSLMQTYNVTETEEGETKYEVPMIPQNPLQNNGSNN